MFPEQETFEGMEMFPRELYTSANIERERERKREKVPFLPTDVPRTRKNEKETK